jgi:hypothetical protein
MKGELLDLKPGVKELVELVASQLADTNHDEYRKQLKAIHDNKENIPAVRKAALKMWTRTMWPKKEVK